MRDTKLYINQVAIYNQLEKIVTTAAPFQPSEALKVCK